MFNYNLSGETITNATQGFWLLLSLVVTSVVYFIIYKNLKSLHSQSGKAERIAHYESKKKNSKNAQKRKAISTKRRFDYIEECKKHSAKNDNRKKESTKILYASQSGICTTFGLPEVHKASSMYEEVKFPFNRFRDYFYSFSECTDDADMDEEDKEKFRNYFKELKSWLLKLYNFIMSNLKLDLDKYYAIFGYMAKCKLTVQFCLILDMLTSLELIENFTIDFKGFKLYAPNHLGKKTKPFDLLNACVKFCSMFVAACRNVPSKGFKAFYEDAINGVFEDDYTYVVSQWVLIETGKMHEQGDIKEFDMRLQRAIDVAREHINANFEKGYYTPKLRELCKLQTSRTASQKDFIRVKPYGILLFGGSSVGKSSIANAITRYVLKVNNFPSSANSVIVLNETDKFQSEFRTHHTGVILDDLCNSTVETTDGNPLLKVIQFINNSPQAALNPNAELKGNVMIEPRVVLATTNVKDLNAKHYSNEPLSVARRFDITVTQTVHPDFQLPDSEMLDTAKVFDAFNGQLYPDFALFTLERPILHSGNISSGKNKVARVTYVPIKFEGREMRDVDIYTFMKYLKYATAKHFSEQKNFVKTQRDNVEIDLDAEGFPVGMKRRDEILESEFGLFDTILEKYYLLEDLILRKLSEFVFMVMNTNMFYNWIMARYYKYKTLYLFTLFTTLYIIKMITLYVFIVFVLLLPVIKWLFYKSICYFVKYKIRKIKKPSQYLKEMTLLQRARLITLIGGVTTMVFVGSVLKFIYKLLKSEAAELIKPQVDEIPSRKEVNASEFWDEHERYKRFSFNPRIEGTARSTTPDQLVGLISRRIMMIHIKMKTGTTRFCNCLPIRGNMMLLPSHIVPDYCAEALITKPGANPKNVTISMKSCYRIPGTDLCVWYVPELGDQRDLTAYFPDNISHGKQIVGDMVYNDQGEIKYYRKLLGTRGVSRTTLGGSFESLSYYFPDKTFQGLCMATFVGRDNREMPFIGGFHLGGRNCTAAAGFITRGQVLTAIDKIALRPSVLPSHAGQSFDTVIGDIEIGPLNEPHELCVTRNLEHDARCVVYGAHNRPGSTPQSEVVVSSISRKVHEHLGLERMHDKPHLMRDIMHKEADIENKTHTAFRFDPELIDKAVVDYETTLNKNLGGKLHQLGKLSDDVVLAGLDGATGINAMNFATACGFPMSGPKTKLVSKSSREVEGISCPRDIDPKVLEEVKKLEETLLKGNRINTVFKASLKDEPTKIGKKKVRVFAGSNIYFIILVRKYFLTISALMQKNKEVFECAVGLNVESPEWTSMMKHVYKHGVNRVVAGDYKSFDGRMSPRFMLASFKILINLAERSGHYDADDLMIMRGIATEICSPTYDYFGTLVQFYGSNPSGHPLTVVTNSLVNSLYMRYVYYKIAQEEKWWKVPVFSEVVALLTYGDDNIMSVKEGYDSYNHTNIARVLAESDITYTMADKEAESVPFIHGSEAGFLKHNAVWDDELQLYRAEIDESSISKMLHAHGRSQISEELHAACTIRDALDKYAHFGREKYVERCEQLKQVAEECNLIGLVGSFPTYREQILKYCAKYEWEENPYPPSKEE